jgi:hypothetical protein
MSASNPTHNPNRLIPAPDAPSEEVYEAPLILRWLGPGESNGGEYHINVPVITGPAWKDDVPIPYGISDKLQDMLGHGWHVFNRDSRLEVCKDGRTRNDEVVLAATRLLFEQVIEPRYGHKS